MKHGLMAEFDSPEALVSAIASLRTLGYRELDAFTPFPIDEVESALDLPRSRISIGVLAAGLAGAIAAYAIQWWTSAVGYPLNVGGFPLHSSPAFIPVTFETAILCASITAFFSVLAASELPRLWDPLFEIEGFDRAMIDRFFLLIDAADDRYSLEASAEHLRAQSPLRVTPIGGGK